jgi:hypothetical protein
MPEPVGGSAGIVTVTVASSVAGAALADSAELTVATFRNDCPPVLISPASRTSP